VSARDGGTPWPEAEQLDFYRRMYFEYLQMWGTDLHQIIVLASEGRWFDLLEYAGDALNARDCLEEGDAETYEVARPKAHAADAALDLLTACKMALDVFADSDAVWASTGFQEVLESPETIATLHAAIAKAERQNP
jgi:hypothetical protein